MKPIKGFSKPAPKKPPSGIGAWVVHKSSQLIAFSKPAALAVQTARTDQPSLQKLASAYAKRDLYLLHRIDQPASGLVLFGRHKAKAGQLQRQFADGTASRTYLAIVEGEPTAPEGELTQHLTHDARANKAKVVDAGTEGAKASALHWRTLGSTDKYRVVEVRLTTGRPHQIRVQLASVGMPIHGDVKYGARRSNANRGIHLHSYRLSLKHPVSGQAVDLEAPLPADDALWAAAAGVVEAP